MAKWLWMMMIDNDDEFIKNYEITLFFIRTLRNRLSFDVLNTMEFFRFELQNVLSMFLTLHYDELLLPSVKCFNRYKVYYFLVKSRFLDFLSFDHIYLLLFTVSFINLGNLLGNPSSLRSIWAIGCCWLNSE